MYMYRVVLWPYRRSQAAFILEIDPMTVLLSLEECQISLVAAVSLSLSLLSG